MNRSQNSSRPGQQITREKKFLKNFFLTKLIFFSTDEKVGKKFRSENGEDRFQNLFFWRAKFRRQVAEKSFGFHIFAQKQQKNKEIKK